jgi:hypothetical protein
MERANVAKNRLFEACPANEPAELPDIAPLVPTEVYNSYWRLAAERQSIFFKRQSGFPGPWTNDPVLRDFKFTNAYRASDRVSQHLIRNVIYAKDAADSPNEIFFRVMLFKIFNRIDTWERLQKGQGSLT